MEIRLYSLRSGFPNSMKFIAVYENNVYNQKQAVWSTSFFMLSSVSEPSCPASTQAKPHADLQSDNAITLSHTSFVSQWLAKHSPA